MSSNKNPSAYNIRWWLVTGDFDALESNEQTFIAESPSYYGVARYATEMHEVCLPNQDGLYSFIIFDDSNFDYDRRGLSRYGE